MPTSHRILIVEDDAALRTTLAEQICLEGEFSAAEADCAASAEAQLADGRYRFDAVLLDVGLPDADGRDLCAKLRREGYRLPIVMLTGADTEGDVIRGLDAGANDYIIKPFRLPELLARLRAQVRLFDSSEHATHCIGSYVFRPGVKLLEEPARNRKVRLTDKENSILRFLYRLGGQAAARQTLLHEVWGYSSAADTHTVETHIYRLRQKIETVPSQPQLLLTAPGRCYKLNVASASA